MPVCLSCGRTSVDDFAFCPHCGAPFAVVPDREQRKTVTVLFCDVSGSTAVGESLDPEALRALLARYFVRMKSIVEAHGGTVEKFIGDAVMAVFGVPVVHEDDALRACRAAVEMRDALPELGVRARIGVNTGEVVTGTVERLATGDPVNVAARLEQAAQPGEVLVGAATMRLVRDTVEAEPVEPLVLKGKSGPVEAWRLIEVRESSGRRQATAMVGRKTELRRLQDVFAQAVRDGSCQMFTVLGTAGVGKSRLAAEFLAGLEARVVRGQCLSYGQGITYWPVVEVVKQLDALPADEGAAAALRSLLGESETGTSAEEIAWAFRKLLEQEAQAEPLICVFDDLHWGEETFLDLVEHVADLARDAPILLLCMARPELLDRRPAWGGGKWNATTTLLEPLDTAETNLLLDELGGGAGELREQIATAAEGNPLFLEEMSALLRESGGARFAVPPTIQALLAARLDQLDPAERAVLGRAAIEGRVFHQSAVQALSDDEPHLTDRLVTLVRMDLIRPDRGQLPDDAYRFRHLLIRDAAYYALPKTLRAELHERFADWLEQHGPDLVELEEILGHHLEQAARYKAELGQTDPALAERAGKRLAVAGRRALWRGDSNAAAGLIERALGLTRPNRLDIALELDLSVAVQSPEAGAAVADAAAEHAQACGDHAGEAAARVAAASFRAAFSAEPAIEELEALARAAVPLLEQVGNHAALTHIWSVLGDVAVFRIRNEDAARASEKALHHARLAGQRHTYLFGLPIALSRGPRPADEALQTLDGLLLETPHPGPLMGRAVLLAMLGRFDEAWTIARAASERWREPGGNWMSDVVLAEIAVLADDQKTAVRYLQSACDLLEEHGPRSLLATYSPRLGRSLCAVGRYDEAEPLARRGRELGNADDLAAQMHWRRTQALVDANRSAHAEAEALARDAVTIAEQTDALNWQGDALCDLAQVVHAAGRNDEAAATLHRALERYERKKNLAMATQVRERLATITGANAS